MMSTCATFKALDALFLTHAPQGDSASGAINLHQYHQAGLAAVKGAL